MHLDPREWLSLSDELLQFAKKRDATEAALRTAISNTYESDAETYHKISDALAPVPPGHPTDDTQDDYYYYQKSIAKKAAHEQLKSDLIELSKSDDPERAWSGLLLRDAHDYLKAIGLDDASKRLASKPTSVAGQPLAEVIWQARNQAEHFREGKNFHPPTLNLWRAVLAQHPSAFGLNSAPQDDARLQQFLLIQSYSSDVLRVIGWDSKAAIVAAASSITP